MTVPKDSQPDAAVRRLAARECNAALGLLQARRSTPDIHAVRRHLKRLRALLKAAFQASGHAFFKTLERRVRRVHHTLSQRRDGRVALECAQGVLVDGGVDAVQRRQMCQVLRADARAQEMGRHARKTLRRAAAELRSCLDSMDAWPEGDVLLHGLVEAVERSRNRCRKAMDALEEHRGHQRFHAWRRRCKTLEHQLLLLAPWLPTPAQELHAPVKAVGRLLGAGQDAQVLLQAAKRQDSLGLPWDTLAVLARRERLGRWQQAVELGQQVFAVRTGRDAAAAKRPARKRQGAPGT